MSRFFETVVLPVHRLLSGRNILPYFRAAQAHQWLSYPDLIALQTDDLRRLLAHACENVPFYRQRFSRAGITPNDIRGAQDLILLPPLTKSQVRQNVADLVAANYRRKDLVPRATGGSTGIPIAFFYDRCSWDSRVGAKYAAYSWAGWDFGVRTALLAGSPIDKAVFLSLRGRMKSTLFRELVLDTFEMSEQTRRQYIRRLQRFRPRVLIGYTSACIALARQLRQDGLSLTVPSIITSAEMLFPAQRAFIEEAFSGRVFDLYGSRETAAIGMECPQHTGLHVAIDRVIVEVLHGREPASAGEPGEIVITDLYNYGMPFIRYKIGDVGRFIETKCPCGRQLPLLELTHGRICDLISTPEGKYLPGEFFPHLFKEVSSSVEQYQIVQASIEELLVKIVPHPSYGPKQTEYLRRKIQDKVGPGVHISFQFVHSIPPEKSGKHRVTISKLGKDKFSGGEHTALIER